MIEHKCKDLQRIDSRIRYQISLGDEDFFIFLKIFNCGEHDTYREVPLMYIDPHEVCGLKTSSNKIPREEMEEEDEDEPEETNGNIKKVSGWKEVLATKTIKQFKQKIK